MLKRISSRKDTEILVLGNSLSDATISALPLTHLDSFSMNDDDRIRYPLADFFNCGSQTDAIDFLGYNVYSWCGAASYSSSGYQARTERFANYSVPLFFSEYGCNVPAPRIFTEVQALFSAPMTGVWSGGIVYEWFQNENKFGTTHNFLYLTIYSP